MQSLFQYLHKDSESFLTLTGAQITGTISPRDEFYGNASHILYAEETDCGQDKIIMYLRLRSSAEPKLSPGKL